MHAVNMSVLCKQLLPNRKMLQHFLNYLELFSGFQVRSANLGLKYFCDVRTKMGLTLFKLELQLNGRKMYTLVSAALFLSVGSMTRISGEPTSSDEESSFHLVVPRVKSGRSVTPRPNDIVCHTTDSTAANRG